jgi:hypothetical protein
MALTCSQIHPLDVESTALPVSQEIFQVGGGPELVNDIDNWWICGRDFSFGDERTQSALLWFAATPEVG